MSKNNKYFASILSFFGKSKQLGTKTKEPIITPVDCVTKMGDKINLFDYLEDAYKEHVAKLEIQCVEEKYKQLTENQPAPPFLR